MNLPLPAAPPAAARTSWPRRLVNFLVALVVLAVAATAFFLSYPGVHAVALQGGVSVQLARLYPGLLDAVLVIACVAAVMLRDGRWWARYWAWLVILVVLAAVGATDAAHAMNYTLPHRQTEGVVAVAPVVVVLLAFSLLLTLLRSSRAPLAPSAQPSPAGPPATVPSPAAPSPEAASPEAPAPEVPSPKVPSPAVRLTALPLPEARSGVVSLPAVPSPTVPSPTVPSPATLSPDLPASAPAATKPPATEPAAAEPAAAEPPAAEPAAVTTTTSPAAQAGPATRAMAVTPATGLPKLTGEDAATDVDYWDADDDSRIAGQVYPAQAVDSAEGLNAGDADSDVEESVPQWRPQPPELDDDAPPFATAPFAPVPRLSRVRATPVPPAGEDESS